MATDTVSYPREDLPVIFADGIANFINSPEFFKFYLYRQDASITGVGPTESRAAAQVVMPLSGALLSIAFLNLVINDLAEKYPDIAEKWKEAQDLQSRTFRPSM